MRADKAKLTEDHITTFLFIPTRQVTVYDSFVRAFGKIGGVHSVIAVIHQQHEINVYGTILAILYR